jgi:hypothetical protein
MLFKQQRLQPIDRASGDRHREVESARSDAQKSSSPALFSSEFTRVFEPLALLRLSESGLNCPAKLVEQLVQQLLLALDILAKLGRIVGPPKLGPSVPQLAIEKPDDQISLVRCQTNGVLVHFFSPLNIRMGKCERHC